MSAVIGKMIKDSIDLCQFEVSLGDVSRKETGDVYFDFFLRKAQCVLLPFFNERVDGMNEKG